MIAADQTRDSRVTRTASQSRPSLSGTRLWSSPFLSREERLALEDAASPARSVQPGIDLLREDERADALFIVTDGWACRYATTRDGGRLLNALFVPGDVGNLDSLMFDRLSYGVRTITQATIVPLARDRALALTARYPGIGRTFTWLGLLENMMLAERALSLGCRSAIQGLAHLLCELSVRLDAENHEESSFAFPLTQEQLANALGLTSVHVNRTMQQLRAEGLIVTVNRTMVIPDVARLRKIGGFDPGYLHMDPPAQPQLATL